MSGENLNSRRVEVEELSLRDVFLIYKRQGFLFWLMLLVFPLIGLMLGLFLPKTYASKAILSLKLQSDQLTTQANTSDQTFGTQQIFSNLPSVLC
jgi:uncharacterized protein involved in exopolysaccharide biosynthesis